MGKRIAFIGLDGAHPGTIKRLAKEGRLPNISALADTGCSGLLKTTNASQSPVAWSTFQTGCNPGKHGIFDFIIRNPKTMQLDIGLANERIDEQGNSHYSRKIRMPSVWHYLEKKNLRSISLFIPVTFPPDKLCGIQVSGMAPPDLRGTQGLPTLYTTDKIEAEKEDRVLLQYSERIETQITGPKEQKIPFTVKPLKKSIEIEVQGKKFFLKKGEWGEWLELSFNEKKGMARFKLLERNGERIKLYLSPVMRSQLNPDIPITNPGKLAAEIMNECGCYKPLSFESDVHGFKEEMIDDNTWLEDMRYTFEQRIKTAKYLLENNKWDFFSIDLFPVDRVQHMFWRFVDKKHPLFEESEYAGVIDETYELADKRIGELIEAIGDATIFFISDHGFASYRRAVELNKILLEEGFLKMKEGKTGNFMQIDWAKTEAYALGFSSVYLNRKGREKYGVVSEKDAPCILENISFALKKFSFDGEKPFAGARKASELYSLEAGDLPDIIPIYNEGFRSAKASAIGAVSEKEILHDNLNKWSGDHIGPFEDSTLPGIIYCNNGFNLKDAGIIDLAPTALDFFGIRAPKEMDGKSLMGE